MEVFKMSVRDVVKYQETIANLLNQSLSLSFEEYIPGNYVENRIQQLIDYLLEDKAIVYGVKGNDDLLGFIWFCEQQQFSEKKIHVVHFIVDADQRGRGIGKRLLSMAEEYGQSIGVKELELVVTKTNTNAVQFYQNNNFGVQRYLMTKRLD